MINTKILIAVGVIGATGIIRIWSGNGSAGSSITRVLVGANVLLVVLAIVDLFGEPFSSIAGGIAMLAVVTILLTQVPWSQIFFRLGIGQEAKIGGPSRGSAPSPKK